MAIPSDIKEVIRLAQIQESEEIKLQELKDKKIALNAQVDDLNTQIDIQLPIVQAARSSLKAAAALIK